MLDQLLREIVILTVGKQAEEIADLLNSKKHQNEFNIAKKMGITINQARNILYKLSDFGLVSSERKKDKKKGWYTYFWKFEIMKCLEFLQNLLLENKEEIKKEIEIREKNNYYVCDLCNLEYDEDEALLMNFTCDECGDLFKTKDNSKLIRELNKRLEKIDERLELINVEIEKEQKKLDKKKDIMLKKEEKEKELKKEIAKKKRVENKRIRDAAKKKTVKKKPAKKKAVKKKVAKKKVVKKKPVTKKKTTKKKTVTSKLKVGSKKKAASKKKTQKKKR
jgi:transcription initiation factor TFIIE subunit alpha